MNLSDIKYDDAATWQLLQNGQTAGVFQMESWLVRDKLKLIKPQNIWELSCVIALIRPGPLNSGLVELFVKNKFLPDSEREKTGNQIVDSILSNTYNVACFQEQLMQLGSRLAWPHLEEKARAVKADNLRKAVGKKNQEKILAIGKEFIEGCAHNKVDPDLAQKLFELIKNSGRYAFNLSHSIIYAHVGYWLAYLKCHYPLKFFCVYLTYAEERLDKWYEIKELYEDSKRFGLDIQGPNINYKNENFLIKNGSIIFGLRHIKYGLNRKLLEELKFDQISNLRDFVRFVLDDNYRGAKIRSNTFESLILTGAFKDTKISRKALYSIYSFLTALTDKEATKFLQLYLASGDNEFKQFCFGAIPQIANKTRQIKLMSELHFVLNEHEPEDLAFIAANEKKLLGAPVSCSGIDNKKIFTTDFCIDCLQEDHKLYTEKQISVVIDEVLPTVTKNGKNPGQEMARISVHDSTGNLRNIPVFPEQYANFSDLLIEGNYIVLTIKMNKKGWVTSHIQQL